MWELTREAKGGASTGDTLPDLLVIFMTAVADLITPADRDWLLLPAEADLTAPCASRGLAALPPPTPLHKMASGTVERKNEQA
jgi:hypothetical protein